MAVDLTALRAVVEPVVAEAGAHVVDLVVTGDAVELYLDRDDGLDAEVCATVSRRVSEALDADDSPAPAEHYRLEVSSPGSSRALKLPRQYPKHLGRTVVVTYRTDGDQPATVEGPLVRADEAGIAVQPMAAPSAVKGRLPKPAGPPVELGYERIVEARIVFAL